MANAKTDKKLYDRLRTHGVRKKVARQLSELPAHVANGKQAPKPIRDTVDRLEAIVAELKGHASSGDRSAAARKAARTRTAAATPKAARTGKAGAGRRSTGTRKGAKARAS